MLALLPPNRDYLSHWVWSEIGTGFDRILILPKYSLDLVSHAAEMSIDTKGAAELCGA